MSEYINRIPQGQDPETLGDSRPQKLTIAEVERLFKSGELSAEEALALLNEEQLFGTPAELLNAYFAGLELARRRLQIQTDTAPEFRRALGSIIASGIQRDHVTHGVAHFLLGLVADGGAE